MNEFKVYSYGGRPIWNDLLVVAQKKLVRQQHKQGFNDLLTDLQAHLNMKKSDNWLNIGCDLLSRNSII